MILIIGLGNPEPEYDKTRHNMGFHVINKIAEQYHIPMTRTKFEAIYGIGEIQGEKVILIKPQTYMNLSGQAVYQFVHFYQISTQDILVIHDDIDIEKGIIKIRKKGGPGTHNGMKSVVQELGTQEFPRIRIGIGTPIHKEDIINYVIGHVSKEEQELLAQAENKAVKAIEEILKSGIDVAMNQYN